MLPGSYTVGTVQYQYLVNTTTPVKTFIKKPFIVVVVRMFFTEEV